MLQLLEGYLVENGCKIIYTDNLSSLCIGRIHYSKKIISINRSLSERDKFLTLVHEAGHFISWKRRRKIGYLKGLSKERREILSYVYGWAIIKFFQAPISREEYRKYHFEY